jgi:hypothetical protein
MTHDQDHYDPEVEAHDLGLSHDLPTLLSRRRALALLGGAGLAAALAGCGVAGGSDGADSAAGSPGIGSPSASSAASAADGGGIPEETAGPYPGDGSNGVNVLTESGIVRSDITRSFGSASGMAEGVPLSTSRSTPAWTRPPPPAASSAPPSWRSPRPPAGRSTPPTATPRASRTWPRPRSRPTWCSATATRSSWPR